MSRITRIARALVALENQGQIPPIPQGMTRLTHFTGPQASDAVVNQGQPFRYGKQELKATTDSFSNQQDVQNLIDTGESEGYTRDKFGKHVLLMDMPHDHHRVYRNLAMSGGELDNRYVTGYVDRTNGQFQANPNYAPHQVPAPAVPQFANTSRGTGQSTGPVPVPSQAQPGESGTEDVW